VGDSVDFVKLDRNHLGVETVRIVDYAAPLHDINFRISYETLSGPARIVRVRKVVAVEDANNVGAYLVISKCIGQHLACQYTHLCL